ncbi:MAG: RluA family pseudouridine synthase [Oscillospiraceae bacterium]
MLADNFTVEDIDVNLRIDKFLVQQIEGKTRNYIQNLINNDNVKVNNELINKNYKIRLNDKITINIPEPIELDIKPQKISINIVYEDNDILVINKDKNMVVHPAPGNSDGTLVNAILYHCKGNLSGINGEIRPGIVHRIDKNTSGLIIIAKNDDAHNFLSKQIKEHSFLREYEAIVYGRVKDREGTINKPIGRDKKDRKKMAIDKNGREGITHYKVLAEYEDFTHLQLKLETGRTHQIRIHLSSVGHPVAGDDVYGPKRVIKELNGQCLHARTLGIIHPTTREEMIFKSEIPYYFENFLKKI